MTGLMRWVAAAALVLGLAAGAAAEDAAAFWQRLQAALRAGNREAVASMAAYPLTVKCRQGDYTFGNPRGLAAMYDSVFTPSLVSKAAATPFSKLKAANGRYTLGRREIVFAAGAGGRFQVVAINSLVSDPRGVIKRR